MADVSGQDFTYNYKQYITLHTLNGGITSSLQQAEDGAGVLIPFKLSTLGISVDSGASYMYNGLSVLQADTALNNYMLFGAGNLTMTGRYNILSGPAVGATNTTGIYMTVTGYNALQSNDTGDHLTGYGYGVFRDNVSGKYLSGFGVSALASIVDGQDDAAFGYDTLRFCISGNANVAYGNHSQENTLASYNSSYGVLSFDQNITGQYCFVGGYQSARFLADGTTPLTAASNSIYIGSLIRGYADNETNAIIIGHDARSAGSNKTVIGNSSTTSATIYGAMGIQSYADSSAPNSSLYYSSTQSKLVWKDAGGVVNNLY